jgi:hypothetical protein
VRSVTSFVSGPGPVTAGRLGFLVELVRHQRRFGRLLAAGPADLQVAQCLGLVEPDRLLPVELEQRQEAGHDGERVRRVRGQLGETGPASCAQQRDHVLGLLAHADQRGVDVVDVHLRLGPRLHGLHREPREAVGADAEHDLGQQFRVLRLQAHGTRPAQGLVLQALGEDGGDLLVGAVLEQPGEEQVAGFEQREVRLVLDLGGGQQPGRLEVEQCRGYDQEFGGLVEVPVRTHGVQVRHELIGDLGQRDLRDVQLVLGDQLEQQVEGTLEVVQPYGEPPVVGRFPAIGAGSAVRSVLPGGRHGPGWVRHARFCCVLGYAAGYVLG